MRDEGVHYTWDTRNQESDGRSESGKSVVRGIGKSMTIAKL